MHSSNDTAIQQDDNMRYEGLILSKDDFCDLFVVVYSRSSAGSIEVGKYLIGIQPRLSDLDPEA